MHPRDLALALLVVVVWGVNFAVIKTGVGEVPPLLIEGQPAMAAALSDFSLRSFAAVAYLAWAATLLGYGLWTRLLSRYPANQVAPFSLLVPVNCALHWASNSPVSPRCRRVCRLTVC